MELERISAPVVRDKLINESALLVCAYDDDDKFKQFHLSGAISLTEFKTKTNELSKDQEIFSIAPDRQKAVLQVWQHNIMILDLKMPKCLEAGLRLGKIQDSLFREENKLAIYNKQRRINANCISKKL